MVSPTFRLQAAKPIKLRSAYEFKQIQFPILHTSPVDIVRHASTQNKSNPSSISSMNIYLSSALGMMYGRMNDRLIYQK